MGIDVSDSLLVGCSYDELEPFIAKELAGGNENDIQVILDDNFNCASPYYDAPREDCFYGFKIQNYRELTEDWWTIAKTVAADFESLTGVKPRIRGGCHVW